jgi:hypothetical protein
VALTPRTAATRLIRGPGLVPTMTQTGTARSAAPAAARARAGGASRILAARASRAPPGRADSDPRAPEARPPSCDLGTQIRPGGSLAAHGRPE